MLGAYRQSLAITRALDKAGHHAIAWQDRSIRFHTKTRHAKEVWREAVSFEDGQAWIQALAQFLVRRNDIGYLFPTNDMEVYALARYRDLLPEDVICAMPDPEPALLCLDKRQQLTLADELGIPQQPYRLVSSLEALRQAVDELGYPCVVKSAEVDPQRYRSGVLGNKAIFLHSAEDLQSTFSTWPGDQHDTLVAQRFAPGPRRILSFVADRGKLVALCNLEVLHNSGVGRAVEGITIAPDPIMAKACEDLVARVGYSGLGGLDYLFEPESGSFCFLEINPRADGSVAVFEDADLNLADLAMKVAAGDGDRLAGEVQGGRLGVRYVWTYGELVGLLETVRRRAIGPLGLAKALVRCLYAGLRADSHLTWRWSDPAPTLVAFWEAAQRVLGRR